MKEITLLQPQKIVFGTNCIDKFVNDYLKLGLNRLFIITMPVIRPLISNMVERLNKNGIHIEFYEKICNEPSITDFDALMAEAKNSVQTVFLASAVEAFLI